MIREEVASDANPFLVWRKVGSQKLDEEPDHLRIGVREDNLVPAFRALRPVEHAPRGVPGIALASEHPSVFLSRKASLTMQRRPNCSALDVAVIRVYEQGRCLLVG
jgi:hypothetical protein